MSAGTTGITSSATGTITTAGIAPNEALANSGTVSNTTTAVAIVVSLLLVVILVVMRKRRKSGSAAHNEVQLEV